MGYNVVKNIFCRKERFLEKMFLNMLLGRSAFVEKIQLSFYFPLVTVWSQSSIVRENQVEIVYIIYVLQRMRVVYFYCMKGFIPSLYYLPRMRSLQQYDTFLNKACCIHIQFCFGQMNSF